MKLKQITLLVGLSTLLATTSTFAINFYAGLGGGISYFNMNKYTAGNFVLNNVSYATPPESLTTHSMGGYGTIYVGLEQSFGHFNLATELSGNYSLGSKEVHYTVDSDNFDVKESMGPGFGLSVLPGYLFSDGSKLYVRAGAAITQFKSTSSGKSGAGYFGSSDLSKWMEGVVGGIGFEKALGDHFALRVEGDMTHYFSFSNAAKNPVTSGGSYNVEVNYKSMNAFVGLVGLTYTFGDVSSPTQMAKPPKSLNYTDHPYDAYTYN